MRDARSRGWRDQDLVLKLLRFRAAAHNVGFAGAVSKKLQRERRAVLQERKSDMTHIRSFRDLDAWQVGMETALATYRLTLRLPDTERYGLVRLLYGLRRAQRRRLAISTSSATVVLVLALGFFT